MARTRSGNVVVFAPVDLLWHSADTQLVLRTLAASPLAQGVRRRTLEVKGRVTQAFVDAAKAAGFGVVSGWLWMPEKQR